MIFSLSKDLRLFSVFQCAIFIAHIFNVSITVNDNNCAPFRSILSIVDIANFITLVTFLFRDTAICGNRIVIYSLIISVISFASRILKRVISEFQAKENSEGRSSGVFLKFEVDGYMWKFCVIFFFVFIAIIITVWLAFSTFFFVTLVKLSIPGDFSVPCFSKSRASSIILLGKSVTVLFHELTDWIFRCFHKKRCFSFRMLFSTIFKITSFSFHAWLFVRISRIWKGIEIDIYEFICVSVVSPMIVPIILDNDDVQMRDSRLEQGQPEP